MYSSSFEQQQFNELTQQRQQADAEALANDSTVRAAADRLERARGALQREISDDAIRELDAAQAGYNQATNSFWRDRRAAARAQANAERDAALEAERQQVAQQREQAEKRDFKLAWVTANGSAEGFEAAWKTHHDAERLKRTEAAQQELRRTLHRQVGYPGF